MSDPHDATVAAYDSSADSWVGRRDPDLGAAREFVGWVSELTGLAEPRLVDLGCGPGWHLDSLGPNTVAMDASASMLLHAVGRVPGSSKVLGDLRALPFAAGSFDGAWAERSLVHVDRRAVPLALWDMHRVLRVGAGIHLGLFEGDLDHATVDGDDTPGRYFSAWPESLLQAVLEGAGMGVEMVERSAAGEVDRFTVRAHRVRTLADTVGPDMRLLLVGLNPSLVAADAGVGFHRGGNRAWPALRAAGLATCDRDPRHLLIVDRVGMTDLVKLPSARADVLSAAQYEHGITRLERLCSWLRPGAVCVLGLSGWRMAVDPLAVSGLQPRSLGGRPVYLMPNPSGANASSTMDDLVAHLRAAAQLADDTAQLADDTAVRPDSHGASA